MTKSAAMRALLGGVSLMAASAAIAQDAAPPPGQPDRQESTITQTTTPTDPARPAGDPSIVDQEPGEEIVVVGTQIRGSDVTDILPVTVLETDDIDATGAVSGD